MILTIPLVAHAATEAKPVRGIGPVYDAAHEITLNGTIQTVVTKHTPGSPAGMHLLVLGPAGVVDAHIGSFLSKQTKETLQEGTPVKIVGAMTTLRGTHYLLARQLTVGDHMVIVRSQRGILAPRPTAQRTRSRVEKKSSVEVSGGAR